MSAQPKWPSRGPQEAQQQQQQQQRGKQQAAGDPKQLLEALYNRVRLVKLRQKEPDAKLGFSLRGGKEATGSSVGVFVSHVERHSEADAKGLKIGDQLIQVNGLNVHEATYEEVIGLIRKTAKSEDILLRVNNFGKIPFQEKTGEPVGWLSVGDLLLAQLLEQQQQQQQSAASPSSAASSPRSLERLTPNAELSEEEQRAAANAKAAQSLSSDEGIADGGESCESQPSQSLADSLSGADEDDDDDDEDDHDDDDDDDAGQRKSADKAQLADGASSGLSAGSGALASSCCSCASSSCSVSVSSLQSSASSANNNNNKSSCSSGEAALPADSLVRVPGGRRTSEPFGCGVVKGPDEWPGIFVQNVKPGSLAERVGLEPGDQLTRADGRALAELTFDAAIGLIKRLQQEQDELRLHVKKGAALKHLASNRQQLRQAACAASSPKGQLAATTTKLDEAKPSEQISEAARDWPKRAANAINGTQSQLSGNKANGETARSRAPQPPSSSAAPRFKSSDSAAAQTPPESAPTATKQQPPRRSELPSGKQSTAASGESTTTTTSNKSPGAQLELHYSAPRRLEMSGKQQERSRRRAADDERASSNYHQGVRCDEGEEEEIRIVGQNCKLHHHSAAHKRALSHVHERFPHPAAKCQQKQLKQQLLQPARKAAGCKQQAAQPARERSVEDLRRQLDQRAARLGRLAVMQNQQLQRFTSMENLTSNSRLLYLRQQQQQQQQQMRRDLQQQQQQQQQQHQQQQRCACAPRWRATSASRQRRPAAARAEPEPLWLDAGLYAAPGCLAESAGAGRLVARYLSREEALLDGGAKSATAMYRRSNSVLGEPLNCADLCCRQAPLAASRRATQTSAACCGQQQTSASRNKQFISHTMSASASPLALARAKAQSMDKLNMNLNLNYVKISHSLAEAPLASQAAAARQSAASSKRAGLQLQQQQQLERRRMLLAQSQQSLCCSQQKAPVYNYATATRMISAPSPAQLQTRASRSCCADSRACYATRSPRDKALAAAIYASHCSAERPAPQQQQQQKRAAALPSCCTLACCDQLHLVAPQVCVAPSGARLGQQLKLASDDCCVGLQCDLSSSYPTVERLLQRHQQARLLKLCAAPAEPALPPPPPAVVRASNELYQSCQQTAALRRRRDTRCQRLSTFVSSGQEEAKRLAACSSELSPAGSSSCESSCSSPESSSSLACSSANSALASYSPGSLHSAESRRHHASCNARPILIGHHARRNSLSGSGAAQPSGAVKPPAPPPLPAPDAEFVCKISSILKQDQERKLAASEPAQAKVGANGAGGKHQLASRALCFVDELKLLAKRQQQAPPSSSSTDADSATNSATLIKIINASKQSQSSCSCCSQSQDNKDSKGACCSAARPPKPKSAGGVKSNQTPKEPKPSVNLLDLEDNKRRQHELLMKEFKSAHSKMFSRRTRLTGASTPDAALQPTLMETDQANRAAAEARAARREEEERESNQQIVDANNNASRLPNELAKQTSGVVIKANPVKREAATNVTQTKAATRNRANLLNHTNALHLAAAT